MKPCISVGWGTNLHLLSSPFGPRTVSQTTSDTGGDEIINEFEAGGSLGSFSDYYNSLYGGPMSTLPGSYFNHKPGVFYYGQFYYSVNKCEQTTGGTSSLYLLRFDGSGIFAQASNGIKFADRSHSGPGVDFIGPSGHNDMGSHGMCCIPHNGNLFYVGAFSFHSANEDTSSWLKEGWTMTPRLFLDGGGNDGGFGQPRRRAYSSFAVVKKDISSKEDRIFGKQALLYSRGIPSGLAPDYESLHGADAISWKDSIIYANRVDLIEFPGGSGIPRAIEIGTLPSSKCFEPHPSGGFDQDTGAAIGPTQLLVLEGSGTIKRIKQAGESDYDPNGKPFGANLFNTVQAPASGKPFGTKTIVDLGKLVTDFSGPKVRTLGGRARQESVTAEPDRSCYLKTFDKRLHAFFISAASGYYHFTCEGEPEDINNWTDRTVQIPNPVKLNDGCMFGYRDDDFGTLNLMHVAKSNIGWAGLEGGDRGNGGWAVYSIGSDLSWQRRYFGAGNTDTNGLIPYDTQGIFAEIPSGVISGPAPGNPELIASTDYALMEYSLYTARAPGVNIDIDIEYTSDDGITWRNATRFKDYITGSGLGDGKTNLEASPFGSDHQFFWAHVADLGFNFDKTARLRVIPRHRR